MPQVIISPTEVLPLNQLHAIALAIVFDKITIEQARLLKHGLKIWRLRPDLTLDDKWEISRVENGLRAHEKGYWNRAKELIKQHNIDYRLMYKNGFPFVDCDNRTSFTKA